MIAVREFIHRVNAEINGVLHVGSHNGDEMVDYLELGLSPLVCFEPSPTPAGDFLARWCQGTGGQDVYLFPFALSDTDGFAPFQVTSGTRYQSTFLPILNDRIGLGGAQVECLLLLPTFRFNTVFPVLYKFTDGMIQHCNALVVDVQGLEMKVLEGMGAYLQLFDYIAVECSGTPVYEGSPLAPQVIAWMNSHAYTALNIYGGDTRAYGEHDDVLFVRSPVPEWR